MKVVLALGILGLATAGLFAVAVRWGDRALVEL